MSRVGRPPKYDFRNKLVEDGDFMIIPKDQKVNARNAAAAFRQQMKLKKIQWDYESETLPNGNVRFTKKSYTGFMANQPAHLKDKAKIAESENVFYKNTFELLTKHMPWGVWYCDNSSNVLSVLFNHAEEPIFEKILTGAGPVTRKLNSIDWCYKITKTGWFYEEPSMKKSFNLSSVFLIKWMNDEDFDNELLTFSASNEPHFKASRAGLIRDAARSAQPHEPIETAYPIEPEFEVVCFPLTD